MKTPPLNALVQPTAILALLATITLFPDAHKVVLPARASVPVPVISGFLTRSFNGMAEAKFAVDQGFASALKFADLAGEELARAEQGIAAAKRFLLVNNPWAIPTSMSVDTDGFASVQWVVGTRSTLLVFSGDGSAAYSIRKPFGSFARNLVEFDLNAIPPGLLQELSLI